MEQQERRRNQWIQRVRTIEPDWLFYTMAFIPFFIISFAVWVCLDEAIFALRYGVVVQWSLFPYFRIFPDMWHYLGILLFVFGMILVGLTLLLHRSSPTPSQEDSVQWFRVFTLLRKKLSKTPVLVILGLVGLLCLGIAISLMNVAFLSQLRCSNLGMGIPCFVSLFGGFTIESLFLHQLCDVLVAIGLVLIFLVIIGERSED